MSHNWPDTFRGSLFYSKSLYSNGCSIASINDIPCFRDNFDGTFTFMMEPEQIRPLITREIRLYCFREYDRSSPLRKSGGVWRYFDPSGAVHSYAPGLTVNNKGHVVDPVWPAADKLREKISEIVTREAQIAEAYIKEQTTPARRKHAEKSLATIQTNGQRALDSIGEQKRLADLLPLGVWKTPHGDAHVYGELRRQKETRSIVYKLPGNDVLDSLLLNEFLAMIEKNSWVPPLKDAS